ncbi:MAG: nicotinate (nicotinamide) nucleotide adenylyltransferase [Spirochaetes bacterium]|nr:nicotinate (nicotinamide) nucleotide adenylyltransferase [Spirochaetota bacterium]
MRIGVFGGTFNPIHSGHLINADFIRDEYRLERLLFVPSKIPVHKDIAGGASTDDRCAMIDIAISGNSGFELSRIEVDRETPSYTITTVRTLGASIESAEIFLIIGFDSYLQLATWKEYRELVASVSCIVLKRPGGSGGEEIRGSLPFRDLLFAGNPLIGISSTEIRERLRRGLTVRYMVPDGVLEYIHSRGLYQTS